ncbi:MAG: ATP-binding cassette domain-containing protein [Candidatus Lokiarchaeota archaeon]|nr:ATP-binding cassette domain-containing protein [Candidatus Lokiarchaeota archaeon]MBD3200288.1 ATP-binding cassette domain-containing protein [Candidatus Lokiarchaeota archaeon]
MNSIEVKNLKKYYDKGSVKAVDDITFKVPKGARFGFLGPNGAGKTTTIRCIMGFLHKDAGEIYIQGEKIDPIKNVEYRNNIGYLPGELGLYKNMNAMQLFKHFMKLYDMEINWKYVEELSNRLELNLDRKMNELSKGNKQKVGVISALMGKFDILIMDEPTSGLDPLMQREFYQIVKERQEESNCTVFLSSHVLPEVENFCDQVAIIRNGKIIEISSVQELKDKSLKEFELDFTSNSAMNEFMSLLRNEYSGVSIKYSMGNHLLFTVPPKESRQLLKVISDTTWDGDFIIDFTIKHSSLDNIFMQYYKGGEIK